MTRVSGINRGGEGRWSGVSGEGSGGFELHFG